MQLRNSNILKLLVFLIAGILTGFYTDIPRAIIYGSIAILLLLLCLSYYYSSRPGFPAIQYFSITALGLTFGIGVLVASSEKPELKSDHYTHYTKGEAEIFFTPRKTLKPNNYSYRYIANIRKVNGFKASGKVLLHLSRDSTTKELVAGSEYCAKTTFHDILPPRNPHQFHYKNYLRRQYVYHNLSLKPGELYRIPGSGENLYTYAEQIRNKISKALEQYSFPEESIAVIRALLLGQKQDIPEDIYEDYAAAGALHILAISGLHVGIILFMLHFLLRPLRRLKYGVFFSLILTLSTLWAFAFIAGMSASVVRAVCMFSFVALAMQLRRNTNIGNVLLVSMFFLLLIKPDFLFDVGFQLSYTAVFAIVWIQPLLYTWWRPKWKAADFLWKLTTVSLAAQLGVLPLSLYYFHQFPGLFFLSNLLIVPALGIILGGGIFIIALALLHSLPPFLAEAYAFIIISMNRVVSWIARQESFIFRDISFDGKLLVLFYLFLIFLFLCLQKTTFRRASALLLSVLCIQLSIFYNCYETSVREQWVILHKNRDTRIARQYGNELTLYAPAPENDIVNDNIIRPYAVSERIGHIKAENIQNLYEIYGKRLLYINSEEVPPMPELKPRYILLGNSPKINLERTIQVYHPEMIIADGSNYKSYIRQWQATCKKEKLPFHSTYEKGAYILSKD
ncbi:ComEC/Rec2 family competence protein [Sinomicrobium sp. M5D2P17]